MQRKRPRVHTVLIQKKTAMMEAIMANTATDTVLAGEQVSIMEDAPGGKPVVKHEPTLNS